MPLPPPSAREPVHKRRIECQGFRREDGLWDIEGSLVDTRTEPMETFGRGKIAPGEHLHEMWLRMTVDADLSVIALTGKTVHAPYPACPHFPERFDKLVGQRIEPGWTAKVRLLLGGRWGCTHLVELLGTLATTAVQTVYAWRGETAGLVDGSAAPPSDFINTCHALAEGTEVVRRLWPESVEKMPQD
ncbi:MAG: DUF2889 domain-containing protein [Gammaproteobacteria bacterium]|nr:DUF2889 domain-containing protein [Gammaproteobacteria bacterium]